MAAGKDCGLVGGVCKRCVFLSRAAFHPANFKLRQIQSAKAEYDWWHDSREILTRVIALLFLEEPDDNQPRPTTTSFLIRERHADVEGRLIDVVIFVAFGQGKLLSMLARHRPDDTKLT